MPSSPSLRTKVIRPVVKASKNLLRHRSCLLRASSCCIPCSSITCRSRGRVRAASCLACQACVTKGCERCEQKLGPAGSDSACRVARLGVSFVHAPDVSGIFDDPKRIGRGYAIGSSVTSTPRNNQVEGCHKTKYLADHMAHDTRRERPSALHWRAGGGWLIG